MNARSLTVLVTAAALAGCAHWPENKALAKADPHAGYRLENVKRPDSSDDLLLFVAFSGGGIRSATFHLGILQALQEMGTLPKIDYLSTVSGGSYIAGWMLAHLGKELDDTYGNLVQTPDQAKLLDPHEDFVTHLRHHAGFIKEGGFWEGPNLLWGYIWRLIPYYIWDLALHIKTPPDIGNELHLFTPYQHRIEMTYLRGKHETPLVRLNRKDVDAPYLIINGNLVNRGRPRAYPNEVDRPYRDNYNFEFTRDYTGSDGLGYIQSAGFGLPVVEAQTKDGRTVRIACSFLFLCGGVPAHAAAVVLGPTQRRCSKGWQSTRSSAAPPATA